VTDRFEPHWGAFDARWDDAERRFQDLSLLLFAKTCGVAASDLVERFNQKGVEADPVPVKKEWRSFQAKFHRKRSRWGEFKKGLEDALEEKESGAYELTHFYCYTNHQAPAKQAKDQEKMEAIAAAAGVTIVWTYGPQILLKVQEVGLEQVRRKFFGGGVNLSLRARSLSGAPRSLTALKQQYGIVPMIERAELHLLDGFLDDPRPFLWWAISGPGASGKSRLANHLCGLRSGDWVAGMTRLPVRGMDDWDPDIPHLVVVDYVTGHESEVANLIEHALALSQVEGMTRVRVLLLERNALPMVQALVNIGLDGPEIEQAQYGPPLILGLLGDEALEPACRAYGVHFALDPAQVAAVEQRCAAASGPGVLMAGVLALVESAGVTASGESLPDTIRRALEADAVRFFGESEFPSTVLDAILLANISGGVDANSRVDSAAVETFGNADREAYQSVVGDCADGEWPAISHDLVNELMVLDAVWEGSDEQRAVFDHLLRLALGVDDGAALVSFFTRSAADFADHPGLRLLRRPFSNTDPHFALWLSIVANTIESMGLHKREQLELFGSIAVGVPMSRSAAQPHHRWLVELLFLRLLASIRGSEVLLAMVSEVSWKFDAAGIRIEIPRVRWNATLRGSTIALLPRDYCDAVVDAVARLNSEERKLLASEPLIQAHVHGCVLALSERGADLERVSTVLGQLHSCLPPNWSPGFTDGAFNILAALHQFGESRRQQRQTRALVAQLLGYVLERPDVEGSARVLSAATAVERESGAGFEGVMALLGRLEGLLDEAPTITDTMRAQVVGATVAAMSHFTTLDQAQRAVAQYRQAKTLVLQMSDHMLGDAAVNLALAIVQLARGKPRLDTADQTWVDSEMIGVAKRYGRTRPDIATSVANQLIDESNSGSRSPVGAFEMIRDVLDVVTPLPDGAVFVRADIVDRHFMNVLESGDIAGLAESAAGFAGVYSRPGVEMAGHPAASNKLFTWLLASGGPLGEHGGSALEAAEAWSGISGSFNWLAEHIRKWPCPAEPDHLVGRDQEANHGQKAQVLHGRVQARSSAARTRARAHVHGGQQGPRGMQERDSRLGEEG